MPSIFSGGDVPHKPHIKCRALRPCWYVFMFIFHILLRVIFKDGGGQEHQFQEITSSVPRIKKLQTLAAASFIKRKCSISSERKLSANVFEKMERRIKFQYVRLKIWNLEIPECLKNLLESPRINLPLYRKYL